MSLEVDDVSLSFAEANLSANDLNSRIRLTRVSPEERLHDILTRCLGPDDADRVPFVVCNPPFFADDEEMREGTTRKDQVLKSLKCVIFVYLFIYSTINLSIHRSINLFIYLSSYILSIYLLFGLLSFNLSMYPLGLMDLD